MVLYLRKTILEQQTPVSGLGVFLPLILLLSLEKHFDILVLHHLSSCTLVRGELWNLRPPLLAGFWCVWWVQFSVQMSLTDFNSSAL